MLSLISLYLPVTFEFFNKRFIKGFAVHRMLLESADLNLIKLFFRYANFVQNDRANVLKISKCFYFALIIPVCYFPTGISKTMLHY